MFLFHEKSVFFVLSEMYLFCAAFPARGRKTKKTAAGAYLRRVRGGLPAIRSFLFFKSPGPHGKELPVLELMPRFPGYLPSARILPIASCVFS